MALTRSLKVYNGSDSVPVTDVTDRTDWPATELATMANLGDAAAGAWLMRDEGGTIPDFLGSGELVDSHNVVVALVGSNTLWRGRLAADEHYRGRQKASRAKEISFTLEDQNSHLRGIVVHEWVRPAETDAARAQALVATYLSGSPRPTTNLNGSNLIILGSNLVSLPAKTYSGVTPYEVMQELASNADKEMFVTVDNELAYFGHDYTGYASLLRISDLGYPGGADANATTYVPWNPRGAEFGRQKLSALRSYYGQDVVQATVRVTNALAPRFDYWEDIYWDSTSATAAQAIARAQKILDYRSTDDVTYSCAIGPMSGDEIWKVKPGQQILFKSRAARGGRESSGAYTGDTFLTTRVREIRWLCPNPDQYIAHLELERPKRTRPPGSGNQALATAPKPAPTIAADTVVSPTTIWSWQFATDNEDDQSSTYSHAWERTESGGFGDYPPANAAFGSHYGRNNAGAYSSDAIPISGGTDYSFRADVLWRYNPAVRYIDLKWYNGATLLRTDRWESGAGRSTNVEYHLTGLYTSPASATHVQFRTSNYAGMYGDNFFIETPGSIITADNDPEALPDGGDSQYWMRSDDPRVLGLIDQMADVGVSWKMPVRVATTGAGTLASSYEDGDTVDGVVLATDDRILIKDQAAGEENGIYIVAASGAPSRATDFDSDDDILGAACFASEGTTNGNKLFFCTTDGPIDLGTTALVFAQMSGGGGGAVATDTIWDASGDLAVGTGSDTAVRLAIGASNTRLVSIGSNLVYRPNYVVGTDPIWDAKGDLVAGTGGDAAAKLTVGTNGQFLVARSGETTGLKWEDGLDTRNVVIDGGGSVISTGIKGDFVVDFACTIVQVTLLADASGSIVVDLWKDTYANFPPVDADSITASAPPTLSSASKSQDSTLTGWTTAIAAGDVIRVNVDSATTVKRVTLSLQLKRT